MPVISVNVKLRTKLPLPYKNKKKIVHNHVPGYKKFKSRAKKMKLCFFPKDFCNNRSMDKNSCFIDR